MRIHHEGIGTVCVTWVKIQGFDSIGETLILAQCSRSLKRPLNMQACAWEWWLYVWCGLKDGPGIQSTFQFVWGNAWEGHCCSNRGYPTGLRPPFSAAIISVWSDSPSGCFGTGAKPLHQISPLIVWYFIGSVWRLSEQNHWTRC